MNLLIINISVIIGACLIGYFFLPGDPVYVVIEPADKWWAPVSITPLRSGLGLWICFPKNTLRSTVEVIGENGETIHYRIYDDDKIVLPVENISRFKIRAYGEELSYEMIERIII